MKDSSRLEPMADFFDRRAESHDDHMRANVEALDDFYDAIGLAIRETGEPIDLLDLGIGTGLELPAIFERSPSARITGIDVSPGMLAELRTKFVDREEQLCLIEGSFIDIDLPLAVLRRPPFSKRQDSMMFGCPIGSPALRFSPRTSLARRCCLEAPFGTRLGSPARTQRGERVRGARGRRGIAQSRRSRSGMPDRADTRRHHS